MVDAFDMRYPGGKGIAGHHQWIVDRLPMHTYYAEPFAGKGGIFRNKAPALRSYIVDLDDEICAWWDSLSAPGTIVRMGDGIRWVELAAEWAPPDLLIYCDPPYLKSRRVKQKLYKHEMTEEQHKQLLTALTALRCPAAISGYSSDLYDEMLSGWQRDDHDVITRGGTMRTECFWRNPAAMDPASLGPVMEYSRLGDSYIERGRVASKIKAWQARLSKMGPVERRALVLGMIELEQRLGRHQ